MKINAKNMVVGLVSALLGAIILCAAFGVFPYVLTRGSFWTTTGAIAGGLYVALELIDKSENK